MEDEEVGEGVGEEEGQAEEEEEAVGEGRDGGAGGRDGEEGRDAGCFFISQLLFEDDAQRNGKKDEWWECTSITILAVLLHVEYS